MRLTSDRSRNLPRSLASDEHRSAVGAAERGPAVAGVGLARLSIGATAGQELMTTVAVFRSPAGSIMVY
jgi:hypothetical protein